VVSLPNPLPAELLIAGAVAMTVAESPRVLALDLAANGTFSADVHDFWRPHGRREALVDGHYSIGCYLDALAGSYRAWRRSALERGLIAWSERLPSEQLAAIAYHVPFCKMAKKAHARLRACDLEDRPETGCVPDDAEEAARAGASFETQVGPSLIVPAQVGNAYTASLYLALAGLAKRSAAPGQRRIGLFSYGSGCSAEFFSGVLEGESGSRVFGLETLAARRRVDVEEYERLIYGGTEAPGAAPGRFAYLGTRDQRRMYGVGLAGARSGSRLA
jgi:hydroxymethylglutaryl-CoA synthase